MVAHPVTRQVSRPATQTRRQAQLNQPLNYALETCHPQPETKTHLKLGQVGHGLGPSILTTREPRLNF